MSRTSDISLGDLLCAFRELEADEETRFEIARLLRLTRFSTLEELKSRAAGRPVLRGAAAAGEDAREAAGARAAATLRRRREKAAGGLAPPDEPPGPGPLKKEGEAAVDQASFLDFTLTPAGGALELVPQWLAETPVLPKPQAAEGTPPLTFEPLLVPNWTRAILSGALSCRSDDGPLDVKRVVERVARGEVSLRLPRFPRPTLARGVQLLVDRSDAMLPYLEDQMWLAGEVQKVVGPGLRETLYFEGCPTRGAGPGSKRHWKGYLRHHLPKSGTVLLLLTDLGIGQPTSPAVGADEREWAEFAGHLRRHGCPVVALVPYASGRWPAPLRRAMTIIEWDRPTNASRVHACVGKGHGPGGRFAR